MKVKNWFTVLTVSNRTIERRKYAELDEKIPNATICNSEKEAIRIMDTFWVKKGYPTEL